MEIHKLPDWRCTIDRILVRTAPIRGVTLKIFCMTEPRDWKGYNDGHCVPI
jgi:hypothetical protein